MFKKKSGWAKGQFVEKKSKMQLKMLGVTGLLLATGLKPYVPNLVHNAFCGGLTLWFVYQGTKRCYQNVTTLGKAAKAVYESFYPYTYFKDGDIDFF